MINREDRDAIEGLFDRLAEAASRAPHRDPDANALIEAEMQRLPGAAYYMAQTIVVEQQALEAAERRIRDLEDEVARRSGGGFGGLFDDGHGRQNRARPQEVDRPRGPWDRSGGGFLAGAAQTALGVAGGVLLGSAIGSLLGAGTANADDQVQPQDATDSGDADPGGFDDGGFGDFGGDGFDIGGDF